MSVETVKTALMIAVNETEDVTYVTDRVLIFKDINDVPKHDGTVQWWEVYLAAMKPIEIANDLVYYMYKFYIDGYYAIDLAQDSQEVFERLVEKVVDKLLTTLELGGATEFGDLRESDERNVGLPSVEFAMTIRPRIKMGLHQARITVWERDAVAKTISI